MKNYRFEYSDVILDFFQQNKFCIDLQSRIITIH